VYVSLTGWLARVHLALLFPDEGAGLLGARGRASGCLPLLDAPSRISHDASSHPTRTLTRHITVVGGSLLVVGSFVWVPLVIWLGWK
jgi:hypothetical protein